MTKGHDIKNLVPHLLLECKAGPMDLVRVAGLAQGTAYKLNDKKFEIKGINFDTASALCKFFTERLGRKIAMNDLFSYEPELEVMSG